MCGTEKRTLEKKIECWTFKVGQPPETESGRGRPGVRPSQLPQNNKYGKLWVYCTNCNYRLALESWPLAYVLALAPHTHRQQSDSAISDFFFIEMKFVTSQSISQSHLEL
ncbi:hypothetical protein O6H91_06G051900 [Diphasiastrum complanatum]|uniref:Uncharacterized protein n=1 Tax=Diphasiastrum complanatum TaxID=34168 RepID=A0ACC2DDW3_DIPCM|nr:hypothetical protein O6H91_06G051900 [Diphasiastrum complanatum]